jgi:hypothetical protein
MRRLPIALLLALPACEKTDDTAAHEDPGEHACEHIAETPDAITAATAAVDIADAVIEPGDHPWAVTLSSDTTSYVQIQVEEEAELLLFVDLADVVEDLLHEWQSEGIEDAGPNEYCEDEIPAHFHLDLHEAGAYQIELAPSAASELRLILMESEGHEHE